MAEAGVSAETLGRALNRTRDEWFARDPDGWLTHHRFYPGIVAPPGVARRRGPRVVIVTTKAERFVRALLAAQNPGLATIEVIGREPGAPVPKPVTLRRLADKYGVGVDGAGLWFVEDMLETLEATATRPGAGRRPAVPRRLGLQHRRGSRQPERRRTASGYSRSTASPVLSRPGAQSSGGPRHGGPQMAAASSRPEAPPHPRFERPPSVAASRSAL